MKGLATKLSKRCCVCDTPTEKKCDICEKHVCARHGLQLTSMFVCETHDFSDVVALLLMRKFNV